MHTPLYKNIKNVPLFKLAQRYSNCKSGENRLVYFKCILHYIHLPLSILPGLKKTRACRTPHSKPTIYCAVNSSHAFPTQEFRPLGLTLRMGFRVAPRSELSIVNFAILSCRSIANQRIEGHGVYRTARRAS